MTQGYFLPNANFCTLLSLCSWILTSLFDHFIWSYANISNFIKRTLCLQGAFVFRGSMIDMPLVLQARNILQTVQNITEHREATGTQGERCTEPKTEDSQSEEVKPDDEKKWSVTAMDIYAWVFGVFCRMIICRLFHSDNKLMRKSIHC